MSLHTLHLLELGLRIYTVQKTVAYKASKQTQKMLQKHTSQFSYSGIWYDLVLEQVL